MFVLCAVVLQSVPYPPLALFQQQPHPTSLSHCRAASTAARTTQLRKTQQDSLPYLR